jgi:hypothetical protein
MKHSIFILLIAVFCFGPLRPCPAQVESKIVPAGNVPVSIRPGLLGDSGMSLIDFQTLETNAVLRTDIDGGWFYPDWFAWSFTQVAADGIPDTTTVTTNNDVVVENNVYEAKAGNWNITYSSIRSADFSSPAVDSSTPSVATATVSKVTYVSSGTAEITATLGAFSRTTNLVMEVVSSLSNQVVIGCVSGSAVCAFANGIDSRLTDGTDKAVYSTQDHAATNYVRNASSWVADIDLTCVSPWNSTEGRLRAGTLIGSDCIIFANHYQIGAGATVRFVTSDNRVISRTLVSKIGSYTGDWCVGKLSSAISTNDCRPALLLPEDESSYMPYLDYRGIRAALWVDQYENAYVGELRTTSHIVSSTDATRSLYAKAPIVGDSGSPVLLIADSMAAPIFCGTLWSSMGGLGSTVSYNAAIRVAAATLGCATNTIVDVYFSAAGFINFNPGPGTP